jgi:hypothetical protein
MTNTINDSFRGRFRHPHVVLPVIHVTEEAQALRNAKLAYEAGPDGVFLINHDVTWTELLAIHASVAATFPDWWLSGGKDQFGDKENREAEAGQVAKLMVEIPLSLPGFVSAGKSAGEC